MALRDALETKLTPSRAGAVTLASAVAQGVRRLFPKREISVDFSVPIWENDMRVISKSMLRAFWEVHPEAKSALQAWHREVESAAWKTPADVKKVHGSASIIGGNRVVFNICGNKYRLVIRFNYAWQVAYTRFIGTHAEYDKTDVERV